MIVCYFMMELYGGELSNFAVSKLMILRIITIAFSNGNFIKLPDIGSVIINLILYIWPYTPPAGQTYW